MNVGIYLIVLISELSELLLIVKFTAFFCIVKILLITNRVQSKEDYKNYKKS